MYSVFLDKIPERKLKIFSGKNVNIQDVKCYF